MDIIIRAGKNIADIDNWKSRERRHFWRGKKPLNDVDKVFFLRKGKIIGFAKFIKYEYRKSKNVQNKTQSGKAFILEGPFCEYEGKFPPKNINKGGWLWRYKKW